MFPAPKKMKKENDEQNENVEENDNPAQMVAENQDSDSDFDEKMNVNAITDAIVNLNLNLFGRPSTSRHCDSDEGISSSDDDYDGISVQLNFGVKNRNVGSGSNTLASGQEAMDVNVNDGTVASTSKKGLVDAKALRKRTLKRRRNNSDDDEENLKTNEDRKRRINQEHDDDDDDDDNVCNL